MRTRYSPLLTLVMVLVATAVLSLRADAQATQPATPVIELRGDAMQLGESHGSQLAAQITGLAGGFLDRALGPQVHKTMARAAMLFEPTLRPAHLAEIKALAAASKIDEAEIML